jgi:hypothetical protein
MNMKIEAVSLSAAFVALAAVGALLAQENPGPRPEPQSPPAASPPPAAPPAPAGEAAPPAAPGPNVEDDVFIPTQELNADDQVTFPVDI